MYFKWDRESVQKLVKGLTGNRLLKLSELPFDFSQLDSSPTAFCESVTAWLSAHSGVKSFKSHLIAPSSLQEFLSIKENLELLEGLSVLQEAAHLYLPRKARLATVYVLTGTDLKDACALGASSYLPDHRILFE